ncbi:MAG: Cys-rich protein [Leptospiraceae bacterium]|nr:Cys-rich protein [Leptospiraceae bacterium]MCB1317545.1 Cys-rich protein [Leptospiraceae bacterium]
MQSKSGSSKPVWKRLLVWSPMILAVAVILIISVGRGLRWQDQTVVGTEQQCREVCDRFVKCTLETHSNRADAEQYVPMLTQGCFAGCMKQTNAELLRCFETTQTCTELLPCGQRALGLPVIE